MFRLALPRLHTLVASLLSLKSVIDGVRGVAIVAPTVQTGYAIEGDERSALVPLAQAHALADPPHRGETTLSTRTQHFRLEHSTFDVKPGGSKTRSQQEHR